MFFFLLYFINIFEIKFKLTEKATVFPIVGLGRDPAKLRGQLVACTNEFK